MPQSEWRSTPHVCPICSKVPATYYGKLVRQGEEVPVCPNHGATVDGKWVVAEDAPRLVPVTNGAAPAGAPGVVR